MKKILLTLFITFCALTSCEVIDELTKFDIEYQTNYTIDPTILIDSPLSINTPDVTTESESTFENNNTRKDLIESVKLKTITLTVETPDNGNFNFLRQIHVYINADELDEIEIADRYDLENTNSNVIELNVLGQELKDYIKKDNFNLRVKTITDETVSETHNIIIDTKFRVDAKILGV